MLSLTLDLCLADRPHPLLHHFWIFMCHDIEQDLSNAPYVMSLLNLAPNL